MLTLSFLLPPTFTLPFQMPPELYSGKPYDGRAVDMWCLGVCLHTMLAGTFPFQASNEADLKRKVRTERPLTLSTFLTHAYAYVCAGITQKPVHAYARGRKHPCNCSLRCLGG